MKTVHLRKLALGVLALCGGLEVAAAEIRYAGNGVTDLSLGTAWDGGEVPGASDVAILSGAGGTYTFGTDVAWQGLVYSNFTDTVTLEGPGTLTLGEKGLTPGRPESSNHPLRIFAPVVVSCDQEWYAIDNYDAVIAIYGPITGSGRLTLRNFVGQPTAAFGIRAPIGTALAAHAKTVDLDYGADNTTSPTIAGPVDTSWEHGLYIYNAGNGETKFSDIFKARQIVNDGRVGLGGSSNKSRRADILFEAGDSIIGNETLTHANAIDDPESSQGVIYQWLGKFHMTGGMVTNNAFTLRAGDYVQEGGSVWLRYGLSSVMNLTDVGQRFLVNGADAKVSVDSIRLGRANGELMQNWMVVSNGTVDVRGTVRLTEESKTVRGANTFLEVAGGRLAADTVCIGRSDSTVVSTNSVARLEVTGGELAIGAGGLVVAMNSWNKGVDEDASAASWYRVRVADATIRATANNENTAAIKLEKTVEMAVDNGVLMTQKGTLSGPATLVKTGAGVLSLPATCAWTGETIVSNGTLIVGFGSLKTPYIRFRADDLALAENATIDTWQAVSSDKTHTNAFTKATSDAVGLSKRPTYKSNRFNGHAAVAFDGSQGLAMTGGTKDTSNDGPINWATNLTIAVVFRATSGVGGSGAGNPAMSAGGILGQYYGCYNNRWTMGIAADGTLCAGLAQTAKDASTDTGRVSLWTTGDQRGDQAHVAIFNWTARRQMRLNVDGQWTELSPDALEMLTSFSRVSGNRLLLGASEAAGGKSFGYFGGEIAEITIFRNDNLTSTEIDAIGYDLANTYGATYKLTAPAEASASTASVTLPEPTGLWRADDLTAAAGEAVTSWKDSTANAGEFTTAIGTAILSGTTAPTVSAETMNGHKAIAFDGVKNMLGMTGSKGSTYIGSGSAFTVALVLRPKNANGNPRGSWQTSVGVMGQAFSGSNDENKWVVGISGSTAASAKLKVPGQQMLMGIRDGSAETLAQHGTPRDMLDGRPHIVICSFATNLTINVDGIRATRTDATTVARKAARTTLGRVEDIIENKISTNGGFFKGDIAEIRFYKNTTLTVAQQNALGRELALKYGADAGGFFADGEAAFLSRGITVAKGAKLLGAGEGLTLPAGQAVSGEGEVTGLLVFANGAVIKAQLGDTGKVVPLAFESVIWPAEGLVVDVTEVGKQPNGVLCTWQTGTAPDVSAWTIRGGSAATKVIVDAANSCIRLSTPRGLTLIIR